jgi:hypothetical protein
MGILVGANLLIFVVYKIDTFILSILYILYNLLKILLFSLLIQKIKKPFNKMPKGWKCLGYTN